ncbi:hypothetical protein [Marinibactrum halimedae]|uniref:Uncharacterized protein n=1 Tax=Marinibactrum halimedae TaxID=1444977 RepID=A0AA37T6M0_9GAMM|nr:hypothetical protein [Marinibactrum halimedae]MCD9458612.1 hypothetical protein [Marinibactrum halimedae]GLS26023.1 hypothetical protein GCM10007877_17380 [Marinibactrum halimedae]
MDETQYIGQFKTIEDLGDIVNKLINDHRDAKNGTLGVMFRVVVPPNKPTSYQEGHQGPYKLTEGVRVCDYKFEKSTGLEWVIPDPTMGLSFSKTFSHLKSTRKMLSRHAKGKNNPGPAHIAWWILEDRDLPQGMAFTKDPKNKHHYFLAVTERMHINTLVKNLQLIAYKMSIIKDLTFGEN